MPPDIIDNSTDRASEIEPQLTGLPEVQSRRLRTELKSLGADWYDLRLPESKALITVLRSTEKLEGIIFGRYTRPGDERGLGAFVATDSRIMFIEKKPVYVRFEEIAYANVTGLTVERQGTSRLVMIDSKLGRSMLMTQNFLTAEKFAAAVQRRVYRYSGQ